MSRVAKLEALLERVQRNRPRPESLPGRRLASTPLEMAMSSAELPVPEPVSLPPAVESDASASPPEVPVPTAQRVAAEVPPDASAMGAASSRSAAASASLPSAAKAFGRPVSERARRPIEPANEHPAPSEPGATDEEVRSPGGPASAQPPVPEPVQAPPLPQARGAVAVVKQPAAEVEPPTFVALIERTLSLRVRDDV